MRLAAILTALLLAAFPAQADQLQDDADALESCMLTAWPRNVLALCAGIVTDPCQAEPGGGTTLGMNQCLAREADAWDAVLDRQWPRLMTRAREVDAANQTAESSGGNSAGNSGGLALDSAVETLRGAQRAWVVFRDAECRHNYAIWGKGSFRAIAHSACRLDLTARRVVDFHARLVTGG
ncbi:MAG: lysozyme inhibitor LprI family protein [Alphaproteobacteria bacterium]